MSATDSLSAEDRFILKTFLQSPQGRRCKREFIQSPIRSENLLFIVRDVVQARMPELMPGKSYTAETLLGDVNIWDSFGPGIHRAMGLCLSFLVETGVLSFVCINPNVNGTKRYVLDDMRRS